MNILENRSPDFERLLKDAMHGDIMAYQALFDPIYKPLKAYLYRLLASRADAEDLVHDVFIRAFDKLSLYKGESSFKTWVFSIGTRLSMDVLRARKRWSLTTKEEAKQLCLSTPALFDYVDATAKASAGNAFEVREHIDLCFSCMGKTLVIEQQVVLILKDIYHFSTPEVAYIMQKTEHVCKHLLQNGRGIMQGIFESKCALINKEGACHQCSELNGWFNGKHLDQISLVSLANANPNTRYDRDALYKMRTQLIEGIMVLEGRGADLQDALLRCDRIVNGEDAVPQ